MFSSNGSLPAETSSHPCSWELWWEDAAVLGERRGSVDFLEFLTQLIWGYVLLLKTYQKVILSLPCASISFHSSPWVFRFAPNSEQKFWSICHMSRLKSILENAEEEEAYVLTQSLRRKGDPKTKEIQTNSEAIESPSCFSFRRNPSFKRSYF